MALVHWDLQLHPQISPIGTILGKLSMVLDFVLLHVTRIGTTRAKMMPRTRISRA